MREPNARARCFANRVVALTGTERSTRAMRRTAQTAVLEDEDLLGIILAHADHTPERFVALASVGKAWHAALHSDAALLLAAARQPCFLTKTTFCGLFALDPREADAFPRRAASRAKGGIMFMYTHDAIDAALPSVGGIDGWRRRLAHRAARQSSWERAFGPDWRELSRLRWAPAS